MTNANTPKDESYSVNLTMYNAKARHLRGLKGTHLSFPAASLEEARKEALDQVYLRRTMPLTYSIIDNSSKEIVENGFKGEIREIYDIDDENLNTKIIEKGLNYKNSPLVGITNYEIHELKKLQNYKYFIDKKGKFSEMNDVIAEHLGRKEELTKTEEQTQTEQKVSSLKEILNRKKTR